MWTVMDRDFVMRDGRPVLKASYIMPEIRAPRWGLRRRGMPAKDAESTIEDAFQRSFREALLAEVYEQGARGELARDGRKAKIWLSVREGVPVDSLFSDLLSRRTLSFFALVRKTRSTRLSQSLRTIILPHCL
jgi:hypothetical protein